MTKNEDEKRRRGRGAGLGLRVGLREGDPEDLHLRRHGEEGGRDRRIPQIRGPASRSLLLPTYTTQKNFLGFGATNAFQADYRDNYAGAFPGGSAMTCSPAETARFDAAFDIAATQSTPGTANAIGLRGGIRAA